MNTSIQCPDDRQSRLLDALPAIAWSASAQTCRFTYVNPAAESLLGDPAERWIDEPHFWTDHLHPEDQYVAMVCHSETVACRNHELVYRMIAADGRTVWLRDYVNVHTVDGVPVELRSEEHTSELQSQSNLVCRLLLEKKKKKKN